jgi:hypothetical protein
MKKYNVVGRAHLGDTNNIKMELGNEHVGNTN